MTKIVITEPEKIAKLITIFRNLKNIVSMVNISITNTEFYIQGMDDSHISFLEILLKNDWFNTFEVEDTILGINTEILFMVINNWKEGYSIEITYENNDYLNITFEGEKMLSKHYEIPIIDLDIDKINVPPTEYDLDLVLDSVVFKDVITELVQFDQTILLSCSLDKILLKSKGDMGRVDIQIKEDDIIEYSAALEEKEEMSIYYSGNSILFGCNLYKINKNVSVHISREMPIKINYEMEDCKESYVRLYVAPKISEN